MAESIDLESGDYRLCTGVGPFKRNVFEMRVADAMGEPTYMSIEHAPARGSVRVPAELLDILVQFVIAAAVPKEDESEEAEEKEDQ